MKTTKLFVALALAATSIGGMACRKSPEAERKEAERAALNAQETAAEAQEKADDKARRARIEALNEHNDYLAAVRREQLDYRDRLHDELDDIEHKLVDMRVDIDRDGVAHYDGKETNKVKELMDRRAALRSDIDALENSTEKDWDSVRERLDRSLGDRPRRGRI